MGRGRARKRCGCGRPLPWFASRAYASGPGWSRVERDQSTESVRPISPCTSGKVATATPWSRSRPWSSTLWLSPQACRRVALLECSAAHSGCQADAAGTRRLPCGLGLADEYSSDATNGGVRDAEARRGDRGATGEFSSSVRLSNSSRRASTTASSYASVASHGRSTSPYSSRIRVTILSGGNCPRSVTMAST